MRKTACVLAAVLVLGLPGCANKQETPKTLPALEQPFQMTAQVRHKQQISVMTIDYQLPQGATVKFENPDSMQGVMLSFDPQKVEMTLDDLRFTYTSGSFPAQATSRQILSAIFAAANAEQPDISRGQEGLTLAGLDGGVAYQILFDETSGNILKLSIPDEELEMQTLNFKFVS